MIEILSVVTVMLLVLYFIRKHYSVWKDMGAEYEEPDFFYGNLRDVGKTESMVTCLQKIYEKHKDQAPFVGIFVFYKPAALITDIELLKNIMIKDFNYFTGRGIYYNEDVEPLAAHMFNIHGPKWRKLRTKLSPTFTSGKMKIMFPMMIEISKRLQDKINLVSGTTDEIDIKQLMARFTTDVIGTVVFGIECNTLSGANNEFQRMGVRVFEKSRHSFPMQLLLCSFKTIADTLKIKRYHDDVHSFFMDVVRSTVDYRVSNKVDRNDFMDLLLSLYKDVGENRITFDELAAQAFVFFAAGFETSSSLLQFCLFELASHPDIQNKARSHIEQIIRKHNDQFTYESMLDMKYIDQILNGN